MKITLEIGIFLIEITFHDLLEGNSPHPNPNPIGNIQKIISSPIGKNPDQTKNNWPLTHDHSVLGQNKITLHVADFKLKKVIYIGVDFWEIHE